MLAAWNDSKRSCISCSVRFLVLEGAVVVVSDAAAVLVTADVVAFDAAGIGGTETGGTVATGAGSIDSSFGFFFAVHPPV